MKVLIIDRKKFKTELGRQLYDLLKPISTSEEWLYFMCVLANKDEKRRIVIDYINEGHSPLEISNFIIKSFSKKPSTLSD